jgi:hypothetical protein
LDRLLRFSPLLTRDEQVLFALGLLDFGVQCAQGKLQLIDGGLLLLPLVLELLAGRLVLFFAR